jgi:nucleotide-binding universal stress UspA family protein
MAHGPAPSATTVQSLRATPLVLHGKPRDVIVKAAQERNAGAVVVLHGSVSTGVLHRWPVPVLVVCAEDA